MRALQIVYSILFWSFFVLSCVPLFVGALILFLITYPFDRNRILLHLYSCAWAQLYFWVNPFWHLHIEGREKLPWNGAAVLAANHESLGDILVLFGLYRPFKWVSKASVFKAPFLGWNMRLNGYVSLVRGDKVSIAKMMGECEEWLRRRVPVLLFPEGTRSPDGHLQAFKDGAFRLAVSTQSPIIPIALVGTRDTLPKRGIRLEHTANCRVQVLDPLLPADYGNDVATLREATRERIRAAREAMLAQSR